LRVEAQSRHSDLAKWTITAIADGSFVDLVHPLLEMIGTKHDIWLSLLPWRHPRYLAVIIAVAAPTIFGCHYCRGGAHDIWLSLLP
jgi:hypothetical protein